MLHAKCMLPANAQLLSTLVSMETEAIGDMLRRRGDQPEAVCLKARSLCIIHIYSISIHVSKHFG